jgi:hypothetical protein
MVVLSTKVIVVAVVVGNVVLVAKVVAEVGAKATGVIVMIIIAA